jgi:epoxyqueuosine reductase
MGQRIFGCDACQEVCPWNRRAPVTSEPAFQPGPGMNPVELVQLVGLDEAAFRERFRGTALLRAGNRGLVSRAALYIAPGRVATL